MDDNPYQSPRTTGAPQERRGKDIPDFTPEQYKQIAKVIGYALLCLLLLGAILDA